MKGKIISCSGNVIVAFVSLPGESLELKTAKGLCGKTVSLEDNSAAIGRISNVIGSVDKPYLAITKYRNVVSSNLINKHVHTK